jgi:hypothetical protein
MGDPWLVRPLESPLAGPAAGSGLALEPNREFYPARRAVRPNLPNPSGAQRRSTPGSITANGCPKMGDD